MSTRVLTKVLPRGFRKLSLPARIAAMVEAGYLSAEQAQLLREGSFTLSGDHADTMVENAIGSFGLPEGIAVNLLVNQRVYAVPMVVEEPSVIAALSYAALLAQRSGGYIAEGAEPLLFGQVQLLDCRDVDASLAALVAKTDWLVDCANTLMPKMQARGGGVKAMDFYVHRTREGAPMLIAQLTVDTRDAMGANAVNTLCEQLAPTLTNIAGGRASLCILSNLADKAIARARVCLPAAVLKTAEHSGEQVRDDIVMANEFALVDPYRATTHNKGIMNGIDAVAVATGNDWRAVEAAAHAYAARSGQYRALTTWTVDAEGNLSGELALPLKVGIVGASLHANPAVKINLDILGVSSATELSAVMAAVGLAQNFSALRALVTSGIQRGHMRLHARSVAVAAGAPPELVEKVAEALMAHGDVKTEAAKTLLDELHQDD